MTAIQQFPTSEDGLSVREAFGVYVMRVCCTVFRVRKILPLWIQNNEELKMQAGGAEESGPCWEPGDASLCLVPATLSCLLFLPVDYLFAPSGL